MDPKQLTVLQIISFKDLFHLKKDWPRFIRKLWEQGILSKVICVREKDDQAVKLMSDDLNVEVWNKKSEFDFGLYGKLKKIIKDNTPCIIHVHSQSLDGFIVTASILYGIRFLGSQNKVPLGIDLNEFDGKVSSEKMRSMRLELGLREDSFVIGNIGDLIPECDHLTLIKALRNLIEKQMNAELVIVGQGPLRKQLEEKAGEFHLTDRVKFVASKKDIVSLLRVFDVYVVSAFQEQAESWIIEAMAMGKPVIATQIGTHCEKIIQGKTGFLVPCGFPERIDTVIMRWKANQSLAQDIGRAGREFTQDKFNLEKIAIEYKNLYNQLTQ